MRRDEDHHPEEGRWRVPWRVLLVLLVACLVAAFWAFDLPRYLDLASLKERQGALERFVRDQPVRSGAVFFLGYVIVAALSLPGAALLTLAAGALFGVGAGLTLVSFASSIGATLAFLLSRFVLGDAIRSRLGDRLAAIDEGIREEGAFYLFTLRLVPLFPFFVVNLVMGLTSMRVATFYGVSQVGMLAGTLVYVNAGTQLARIDSLSDVLSTRLVLSFAALGLFPLVARRVVALVRRRRELSKWRRPRSFDYNVIVVGAGSGGLVSAYIAAAVKAKVALIEKHAMGGDCLNTGCVPSKALIRSAKALEVVRKARDLGFRSAHVEFDFAEVMERVRRVVRKVAPHDSVERYAALGVECIIGEATIFGPHEVGVDGRRLTARAIIVATGASPVVPRIEGLERIRYFTSETIWDLRSRPGRLLILGGGPIGCELAQAFARLGSSVILVDRAGLLGREDPDVADFVSRVLSDEGVDVVTGAEARRFVPRGEGGTLVVSTPEGEREIPFDTLLLALGRKPRVEGFGLEKLGVRIAPQGHIDHDAFLRTNVPGIYCVGDVAGPYQLTHAASHQAWYATVNALFAPFKAFKVDYRVMPRVTFTDPEVATVGLTEREAKAKGVAYELTTYGIDDLDRALTDGEAHGFVKVLTVPGKDRILGATVVGAHAGESFVEFVVAMKNGHGLKSILGTVHAYPTFAESNKYVAGAWRKAHAPRRALALLERFHRWRRS